MTIIRRLTLSILVLLNAAALSARDVYLFSYFRGEKEGLHLAYSYDGLRWTALNGNRSLLKPEIGEDRLMRDPSIVQGPDGTFHMVWTSSWHDRIIGYASSRDLLHWSKQRAIPVMAHEPEAQNCWAPELFYDEPTGTSPSASSTSPGLGRFRSSLARQAATRPRRLSGTPDRSGSCCKTRITMVGIAPSPNGPTPLAAYTSTAP